jgi:hypothetical protein
MSEGLVLVNLSSIAITRFVSAYQGSPPMAVSTRRISR